MSVPLEARRHLWLLNAAHSLTHYSLLILPTAVLTMARQHGRFGSAYGPILELATGGFVLYGLFALPQGWLAARFGRHALLAVFFFGTSLSLIACGLAAGPLGLAAALAAAGFFAAIYHPVGTALLVDIAGERVGKAVGVNGMCGNFGVASAPLLSGLLAYWLGWRAAFVVPGLIGIGVGAAWLRLPSGRLRASIAARPFPRIPPALVRRAVVVLLVIAAVSGLIFNAFTLLIPKLMEERLAGGP